MSTLRDRFKNLHWVLRVLVAIAAPTAVGILGAYYIITHTVDQTPKLTDFTETTLKAFVKKATNLDVREVKIKNREGLVSVSYFDDSAYDENGSVYIIARDAKSILQMLFKIVGVKKVKVIETGTYVDNQGKSVVEPSVAITLSKSKADNIDWDKVNTTNRAELISFASELYVNPAIKEEITNEDILRAFITQMQTN